MRWEDSVALRPVHLDVGALPGSLRPAAPIFGYRRSRAEREQDRKCEDESDEGHASNQRASWN
jgi:hypothetical protein